MDREQSDRIHWDQVSRSHGFSTELFIAALANWQPEADPIPGED